MKLLRVKEAARLAGVSEATVRRWINAGALKVVRPVPNSHPFIQETALRKLLGDGE